MNIIDRKMDLVGGQAKRSTKRGADQAKDYYKLGKVSANVEQQRKESEQNIQLNMLQQVMINQASMELQKVLAEVTSRQQSLDQQMQAMMAPPALPGAGMPPLPMGEPMPINGGVPPEALMGGDMGMGMMPPEASGMPPGAPGQAGIPVELAGAPPLI